MGKTAFWEEWSRAAYPCYFLDEDGQLAMNEAAKTAPLPLCDEKAMRQLLQAAMCRPEGQCAREMPLLTDALQTRTLMLLPIQQGLAAVALDAGEAPTQRVSEKMREPLTNIFALLPLLTARLEGDSLPLAQQVQDNCYQLLRMVSNLENAGRLERQNIRLCTADLTSLIEVLCQCVASVCGERGVPIEWQLPKMPLPVRVDVRLFSDAFLNLVRNSLQYTRDGNAFHVRLEKVGDKALLTVEDAGLGIKPEHVQRVFDPYFSVDPYGDDPQSPGAGMGLAVVREAVHTFGGTVNLESRFGKGTRVFVSLPVEEDAGEMLESNSAEYLLNRYSPVYIQLCGYCRMIQP